MEPPAPRLLYYILAVQGKTGEAPEEKPAKPMVTPYMIIGSQI